jgi:hypothetical protein
VDLRQARRFQPGQNNAPMIDTIPPAGMGQTGGLMYPTTSWQAKKATALSAVNQAILTKYRAERASRKVKREWMSRHGLKPTRAQTVYRVETDATNIPEWAEHRAIPGFSREPDVIWVKQRNLAKTIAEHDRAAGGQPRIDPFEARRCPLCKRWHLGPDAQMLRHAEETARLSRKPLEPCSIWCQPVQAPACGPVTDRTQAHAGGVRRS